MVWWQSILIGLAGALVGASTSIFITRINLRAARARDEGELNRRRLERSTEVAANLQERLLDFISACDDQGLNSAQFASERAAWSRAVRNALPELEPDKKDSTLRGLLNRTHEEVLKAELYWHGYGGGAGRARLEEALDVCQSVVRSLSDYRSRRHDAQPYTTRSVDEGRQSRDYWALSSGGGSTVPTNGQNRPV